MNVPAVPGVYVGCSEFGGRVHSVLLLGVFADRSGVLRNSGLHAFDGKPMSCRENYISQVIENFKYFKDNGETD